MKFKKISSNFLPFLVLILLSLVLLALAYWTKNSFVQNIFSNMAATSLYALIAIFTYDRVKNFADREKAHELRNYAQSEIDPQIMAILISLARLLYSKEATPSVKILGSELEKLTKKSIENKIKGREYLGFEILRNSDETTKNIRRLLENNFIRPLLEDEQMLLLLKVSNRLEKLFRSLSETENLIKLSKPMANDYIIFGSKEISSYNAHYPNRKLLVKKFPKREGMGIVEEFADFSPQVKQDELLSFYKIKDDKVDLITATLFDVLQLIKKWIKKR